MTAVLTWVAVILWALVAIGLLWIGGFVVVGTVRDNAKTRRGRHDEHR